MSCFLILIELKENKHFKHKNFDSIITYNKNNNTASTVFRFALINTES